MFRVLRQTSETAMSSTAGIDRGGIELHSTAEVGGLGPQFCLGGGGPRLCPGP